MKIVAIVKDRTEQGRFVMRTDPIMTEAVFALAHEHLKQSFQVEDENGHLVLVRSSFDENVLEELNRCLSDSENRVNLKKAADMQQREEFLKSLSEESGLPLE